MPLQSRRWATVSAILFVLAVTRNVMAAESIPYPAALDAAAISVDHFGDVGHQLIIGNGDINGLVEIVGGKLTVRLSKNDIGDWRYDSTQDPPLVKIGDIRRLGAQGKWVPPQGNYAAGKDNPCPVIAAVLSFELGHDVSDGNTPAILDLRRAVALIGAHTITEKPLTTVRALAGHNVFLIDATASAEITMPEGKSAMTDGVHTYTRTLPASVDLPGMTYTVAIAEQGSMHCIAVVTSLESKTPAASAVRLARESLQQGAAALVAAHEKAWEQFWSASGVNLDDTYLRDTWYRNLYFLHTVSTPGAVSVGLFAGVEKNSSAWHGNHTMNYNAQQTFWGGLAANHVDLLEPYKDLMCDWIPKGRWVARNIFQAEGTYFPHNLNTFNVDPAQSKQKGRGFTLYHPWSFSLCCTGWSVQNIWFMYQYAPDRTFLEKTAYPAVREAAMFYASFLESCDKQPDGKARFGPTAVPERIGWLPDLSRNYDSTADISYARWTFNAAIEGAQTLHKDVEMVRRFKRALNLLPDYPTFGTGNDKVVVICGGAQPQAINIAVLAMPVFPNEEVTYFSAPPQKDLFAHTLLTAFGEGYNEWMMMCLARERLSLPGTVDYIKQEFGARQRPNGTLSLQRGNHPWNDFGHYTETFAATAVVSELMLQSAGDIIRVFPTWPEKQNGKFTGLRAKGGFLVSAQQADGQVKQMSITSTAGGKLRVLSPWPAVSVQQDGVTRSVQPDGHGILELNTKPDQFLILTASK